jgi:hypothetical protein
LVEIQIYENTIVGKYQSNRKQVKYLGEGLVNLPVMCLICDVSQWSLSSSRLLCTINTINRLTWRGHPVFFDTSQTPPTLLVLVVNKAEFFISHVLF